MFPLKWALEVIWSNSFQTLTQPTIGYTFYTITEYTSFHKYVVSQYMC